LLILACLAAWPLRGAEDPKGPAEAKPAAQAKAFKNVGVAEFDKLRADKQNQVLDVRTAPEFAKGHMPGAINIDVNAPDFAQKIATLDNKQTYLVHCAAGARSARACGKMSQLNFSNLYNLEGGFKAWEKAGKPVEK
jgi:rhodanese-related sulfurtransferase